MQELYGSLDGDQRRIGAYSFVQYVLIVGSKEVRYHMLKGNAELALMLRTNLPMHYHMLKGEIRLAPGCGQTLSTVMKAHWASSSPAIGSSAGPTLSRSQARGCTRASLLESGGVRWGG